MKKITLIISLLIICSLSIAQTNKYFVKGNNHMSKGHYKKAIKLYTKAIEIEPASFGAYANRGMAYGHVGKYSKSVSDLKTALDIKKNDTLIIKTLAIAYTYLKKYKNAISYYKRGEELGVKGDAGYNFDYGTVYFRMEKMDSAIYFLERSFAMDSLYSGTYNNLAWCYLEVDPHKSCRYFKKAYELDTLDAPNVNNLGYAYLLSGEMDKALYYIKKAEKLDPQNSFVYRNYGLYYMRLDDKKNACNNLTKAINLGIVQAWGVKYIEDLQNYCEQDDEEEVEK